MITKKLSENNHLFLVKCVTITLFTIPIYLCFGRESVFYFKKPDPRVKGIYWKEETKTKKYKLQCVTRHEELYPQESNQTCSSSPDLHRLVRKWATELPARFSWEKVHTRVRYILSLFTNSSEMHIGLFGYALYFSFKMTTFGQLLIYMNSIM